MPDLTVAKDYETDFYFVEARDPDDGVSKVVDTEGVCIVTGKPATTDAIFGKSY